MKTWFIALKLFVTLNVLTGIFYPALITVFGQAAFLKDVQGSLIKNQNNEIIGSELIAQKFTDPKYFSPRPSAIDYNPMPSGGTNLGPTSQALIDQIKERKSQGLADDLLFTSGSGLDPHISPKAALNQVGRVASARGMSEEEVRSIVGRFIEKRQFKILGEERVNVLLLNLALDGRQ